MLITNFASGELSPKLNGRVDLNQYWQGCGKLENFNIIPTGGIQRRTGFKRILKLEGDARLIPFIVNSAFSFIICIYPGKIVIYDTDFSKTFTINDFPYTDPVHIASIHYAQNYDTLIICSRFHRPYKLVFSIAEGTFTAGPMAFDFMPDVNLDDDYDFIMSTVNLESVIVNKSNKTVTYTNIEEVQVTRTYSDIDSIFMIYAGKLYHYKDSDASPWQEYDQDPDIDEKGTLFTTEGKYPAAVSFYNNRLFFAGTDAAPQKIWASATPDTTGNRYNDFSTYQKYVTVNKVLKDADVHIFTGKILATAKNVITDVTQDFTQLDILQKDISEYFVTNANIPVGTKVIGVTATTLTLSAEANIKEDLTAEVFNISLWKVSTSPSADDYEMKVVSNNTTTSDCSFNFEIASQENDAIKFIAAAKYLTVGTESSVWIIPNTINALQIIAENNGRYGSDDIQGICIDTAVVFFAQGKYAIREHYYNAQSEAFQTNNIAIMAEQMLTESPAADFDYMNNPYNRLFIIREDGKSVQLLYDKNNGVMGWNRITHGKAFLRQCCITRGDRQNDHCYVSVRDGKDYYLELLDENNQIYLDSWKEWKGSLEGYSEEAVLYNSTTQKICETPAAIPEDFISEGDVVYVGYYYISDIISMPVLNNDPTGKKRITSLLVRFLDSYMPEMKIDDLVNEKFINVKTPFSGVKSITYPGISDRDVTFELTTCIPERVSILSINANIA